MCGRKVFYMRLWFETRKMNKSRFKKEINKNYVEFKVQDPGVEENVNDIVNH